MAVELKPCPFCGTEQTSCARNGEFSFNAVPGGWVVMCENLSCCAEGPARPTKEEAVRAWNQREAQ